MELYALSHKYKLHMNVQAALIGSAQVRALSRSSRSIKLRQWSMASRSGNMWHVFVVGSSNTESSARHTCWRRDVANIICDSAANSLGLGQLSSRVFCPLDLQYVLNRRVSRDVTI